MHRRSLLDLARSTLGITTTDDRRSDPPSRGLVDIDRPDADEDWLNDPLGCMREAQFGDSCV